MTIINENKSTRRGQTTTRQVIAPHTVTYATSLVGSRNSRLLRLLPEARPLGLALILEDQRSNIEVYVGHRG